ncbi:MAG: 16S rRNA methyltransferase [Candidatus Bathyarchaeota archaeon]|nr:16S rRNA methyltransferase [Candidatus Bathyarchaeota archaeon]
MVKLLTLILAESALETIPKKLWKHSVIKHYSEKRGKAPKFLLLDRSYHHTVMKSLKGNEKRGRPDIAHFTLLEALSSPLNKEQLLQVFVHTINDYVITVNPQVRLPKNYNRFIGLMEQLFEFGKIPPTGSSLLTLTHETLAHLLQRIKPTFVLALTRKGTLLTVEETVAGISDEGRPVVVIGAFPHGHFSSKNLKLVDKAVSIDAEMLETWIVTSRVIYEYERAISLPKKRLSRP